MSLKLLRYLKKTKFDGIDTSPQLLESIQQALFSVDKPFTANSILEIGSRDGHDAYKLHKLFGIEHKHVHIIEPHPSCIKYITKTYPQFKLYPYAIYDKEGTVNFNKVYSENIGTSSILNRKDDYYLNKSEIITVDTITGLQWLITNQINEISICKIDVEGATLEVLKSFGSELKKIKLIHLECEHQEIWEGQSLYAEVANYLNKNGYRQLFFNFVSNDELQSDSIWYYD